MKKKIMITTLMIATLGITSAYAAYGNSVKCSVSSTQNYSKYSGTQTLKTSNNTDWQVRVTDKTMWSKPSVRLANSNNSAKSTPLDVGVSTYNGTGNTGSINYYYYASIKPAWNQIGTDDITLQVNAY